jgi:hypothetical protein
MPQPAMFTNDAEPGSKQLSAAPAFDKLQQLASQGYVPDSKPLGDGILLRHPTGPNLVLRPDGTIDLPSAPVEGRAPAAIRGLNRRISWGRSFLFVLILMIGIFVGWVMTALVFAD